MGILYTLIIGAIIGWLAGVIMKGGGFGLLGDIVVGILGALIGGWVFGLLGISVGAGLLPTLLSGVVGAVILIALVRVIKRA